MAANYMRALGTTLRGVRLVGVRWLRSHGGQTPVLPCQSPRLGLVSPAAYMCTGSRTEAERSSRTEDKKAREEEEEEEEEEEDSPRKPKNPMVTVGLAWMIGMPTGIIGFILTKREVDKNRLKQLKVRQRMGRSNDGEYEGSRYHRHAEAVER